MPSPDKSVSVKVEGLTALRKELKKLDDAGLTGELKDANMAVGEFVVARAKSKAAMLGRMETAAAGSLKAGHQAARAVVSGGSSGVPFFFGAEFGSTRFKQFDYFTGRIGRFLYPTIRSTRDDVIDIYDDALVKITRKAFPD